MSQHTDISLSLDEIIRLKRSESYSGNSERSLYLSLDDHINILKSESSSSSENSSAFELWNCTNYTEMSLDEIIQLKQDKPSTEPTRTKRRAEPKAAKSSTEPKVAESSTEPKGVKRSIEPEDAKPSTEHERAVALNMKAVKLPRLTPYRAVGFLAENGMIIEIAAGRQKDAGGDRSHLWRCTVSCGEITAIADSIRKVVAREMACREFLTKLRQVYKNSDIPDFEVPEELFIDPRLFHKLEKEAVEKAMSVSIEVKIKPVNSVNPVSKRRTVHYSYVCTYLVGKDKFKGESFVIQYAKLLAARAAYIHITGREPQPTSYFTGAECDSSLKYADAESEVFQTLSRDAASLEMN